MFRRRIKIHIWIAIVLLFSLGMPQRAVANTTLNSLISKNNECLGIVAAIEKSLKNDPRIEYAKAGKNLAGSKLRSVKSKSGPQISSFAQIGSGDGQLFDRRTDNQTGIQVRMELYDFGATKFSKKSAHADLEASFYNLDVIRQMVINDSAAAFLEALRASELFYIAQQREAYHENDLKTIDKRLQSQVVTVSDVSQVKGSHKLAISRRVTADLDREAAFHRLARHTGEKVICLSTDNIPIFFAQLKAELSSFNLENLLESALKNAPAIRQSMAKVKSGEALVKSAYRETLPKISVSGFKSYEYLDDTNDWVGEDRVGINIVGQLYTSGRGKATRDDAKARLQSARSSLEESRQATRERVLRSYAQLNAQNAAGEALAAARGHLRQQLETTEREYEIRTRTLTDVIRAADAYFDTAAQEVNIRHQAFNSMIILRVVIAPYDIGQLSDTVAAAE